jgi:hypothetical protein
MIDTTMGIVKSMNIEHLICMQPHSHPDVDSNIGPSPRGALNFRSEMQRDWRVKRNFRDSLVWYRVPELW